MQIAELHSYLNGWEHLQVHKLRVWQEIVGIVESIDAVSRRVEDSPEQETVDRRLYSHQALDGQFRQAFLQRGWREPHAPIWVTPDFRARSVSS
jgi:hypothetical protein